MVKTAISSHAKINRDKLISAIAIFGKSLVHRVVTKTLDNFGQLTATSTADTSFKGDLQFGLDLDQRYLTTGVVEVGEGVLYVHPTTLATLPSPQDQIIDGNSEWEVLDGLESPELDGTVTFYSYRCRRRINATDT